MPSIPIHPPAESRSSGVDVSQLPLTLRTPSGLAIVEIQGTINATQPGRLGGSDRVHVSSVGKLVFPDYDRNAPADDTSWHKRVHLYVGKHQRLTGEVKKLAHPVAILQRRETTASAPADAQELEIAEIVHYKLLFAHRPEPVGGGGG